MFYCHQNLTINDLVSNHESSPLGPNFNREFDHIVFYKRDRSLNILKTCYENLEGTDQQVFHL